MVSFLSLDEAPQSIVGLGLVFGGTDGHLAFATPPTQPNVYLTYNGASFAWNAVPTPVTEVRVIGEKGAYATGSPIHGAGTIRVGLTNTGVGPGTYVLPTISVDAQGRIVAAASGDPTGFSSMANLGDGAGLFVQKVDGEYQLRSVTAGAGVQVVETPTEIIVSAATDASGVTPGTYVAPTLTVDARGRVVAATTSDTTSFNGMSNLGTGKRVFATKTGKNFFLRSLVAGAGVQLVESASEITVSATASSGGLLYGSGAPNSATGVDGSSYIDEATGRLYGPKTLGAWPAGFFDVGTRIIPNAITRHPTGLTAAGAVAAVGVSVSPGSNFGLTATGAVAAVGVGAGAGAGSILDFTDPANSGLAAVVAF